METVRLIICTQDRPGEEPTDGVTSSHGTEGTDEALAIALAIGAVVFGFVFGFVCGYWYGKVC